MGGCPALGRFTLGKEKVTRLGSFDDGLL